MGERRSEFRRSTPCCEMGMLDWTPAHQHATGAGAGGSPTLPLPQTCRRLKLGLQSASIELSGGYFCFLRDNIWLEDEKEPGTSMSPITMGASAIGQWYGPPPPQMGAQSGQAPVIAQDQSASGSDSRISGKSQGKNQQKKREDIQKTAPAPTSGLMAYSEVICYNCGEPGHHLDKCVKPKSCFICKMVTHKVENCPRSEDVV